MKLKHSHAVWLMVLAPLLWSTAGVVTRQLENARAFEITFWRSFFTAVSLLVILPLWQGRGVWARMWQERQALLLSGVCWGVMFTAFMVALTLTTVANVLVTMAVGPFFTAVLAWLFAGQRIALRTWVAIAVAGVGIAWMYGNQFSLGDGSHLVGTLVALCVPLAGAVNWTVVQRSQVHGQQIDLVPAVMVGAVLSSLVTLPLAHPFSASAHDIGLLAFLGLTQLAIPCVLSVLCARVLKAPEISLLALLEVIFGILLAWLGAGEVPTPTVFSGGALVIGALVINEWLAWRQRP